jgi:hypothetical protein
MGDKNVGIVKPKQVVGTNNYSKVAVIGDYLVFPE